MKFKEYITPTTIIFTLVFMGDLALNAFLNISPIFEFFNLLKNSHILWAISFSLFVPLGIALLDKIRYKKNTNKQLQQFQTTLHTIQ